MLVTDVHHEAAKAFLSKEFGANMIYFTKFEFVGESYRFRHRLQQDDPAK